MGLYTSNIDLFIEQIFFGFGSMMFLASIIVLFAKKQFLLYVQSFVEHSIKTIKYAGIIGIIWFLTYMISYYSVNSDAFNDLFSSSNTVQEKWLFWIIFLRFPVLFGLTQLFWIKKARIIFWLRNIIVFFVMFVAVLHGRFLEKCIIFITSFHRDYLPSNYSMLDGFDKYIVYFIGRSCIIFIVIVLIFWGISVIMNRLKRTNV